MEAPVLRATIFGTYLPTTLTAYGAITKEAKGLAVTTVTPKSVPGSSHGPAQKSGHCHWSRRKENPRNGIRIGHHTEPEAFKKSPTGTGQTLYC